MKPVIFDQGFQLNAESYMEVLANHVKLWMDQVGNGRQYVFQ